MGLDGLAVDTTTLAWDFMKRFPDDQDAAWGGCGGENESGNSNNGGEENESGNSNNGGDENENEFNDGVQKGLSVVLLLPTVMALYTAVAQQ